MNKKQFIEALSAEKVPSESGLGYKIPVMDRSELEKRVGPPKIVPDGKGGMVFIYDVKGGVRAVIFAPPSADNQIRDATVAIWGE